MIDGDPKKPGTKLGLLAKALNIDKRLQKGLLRQVLGLLRIQYQPVGQAIYPPLILFHQFLEGREITFLGPGHELGISHRQSSWAS